MFYYSGSFIPEGRTVVSVFHFSVSEPISFPFVRGSRTSCLSQPYFLKLRKNRRASQPSKLVYLYSPLRVRHIYFRRTFNLRRLSGFSLLPRISINGPYRFGLMPYALLRPTKPLRSKAVFFWLPQTIQRTLFYFVATGLEGTSPIWLG
jgi:hypothetical protein